MGIPSTCVTSLDAADTVLVAADALLTLTRCSPPPSPPRASQPSSPTPPYVQQGLLGESDDALLSMANQRVLLDLRGQCALAAHVKSAIHQPVPAPKPIMCPAEPIHQPPPPPPANPLTFFGTPLTFGNVPGLPATTHSSPSNHSSGQLSPRGATAPARRASRSASRSASRPPRSPSRCRTCAAKRSDASRTARKRNCSRAPRAPEGSQHSLWLHAIVHLYRVCRAVDRSVPFWRSGGAPHYACLHRFTGPLCSVAG